MSSFLVQPLTNHSSHIKLLHNLFEYMFHIFVSLSFSHTVSFHLAPYNCLQHYHISYFFMQPLTNHLSSTILLHYLFIYIFYTFASFHLSHTISFSLASYNYLQQLLISSILIQPLTSNLSFTILLHNLL